MEASVQLEDHSKKRERQTISVPFLWEERPGNPKKEWASKGPAPFYTVPSQPKLVVSIPFQWEQEPGKPLLHLPLSSHEISSITASLSYNPIIEENIYSEEEKLSSQTENRYSVSETDTDSSSYSSSVMNNNNNNNNMSLNSSELELLFPLSSPNAGFLDKVALPVESSMGVHSWKEENSGNLRLVVKRNFTLGELIMLSRKLSCRMKPTNVKKPTSMPMVTSLAIQPYNMP
ncbi:hypothetical protein DsansV1_C04g0039501 [Dioscorea sansibarensis]